MITGAWIAAAWYELLLAVLATWRVTHLLHAEDGPWDAMARLRAWAGSGMLGQMMDCFYCLSLWVSIPFTTLLATDWRHAALLWPALSGAAMLLHHLTQEEN